MTIGVVRRNDPAAVERMLRGLPQWFAIESALQDYVKAAGTMTSYLAISAAEAERVVGVILVERHFPVAVEIHLMAVDAGLHRQGVGRALLGTVERQLRTEGVRWLQVKTLGAAHASAEYVSTRKFYEAVGFAPLEEFPGFWKPHPMLLMVKSVD